MPSLFTRTSRPSRDGRPGAALPSRVKAVIFDLDGVLCHTDRLHFDAWKTVCEENDLFLDEQIGQDLRGVSREESLEVILRENRLRANRVEMPPERKRELLERKNGLYREMLETLTPRDLPSGVRPTLLSLRAAGLFLAVGSSSRNAGTILERLRILNLFDTVSDGVGLHASKPDPEVFLKASAALGLPPRVCLVVEDAPAGIEAGIAGGFLTAGIGPAAHVPGVDLSLGELPDLVTVLRG